MCTLKTLGVTLNQINLSQRILGNPCFSQPCSYYCLNSQYVMMSLSNLWCLIMPNAPKLSLHSHSCQAMLQGNFHLRYRIYYRVFRLLYQLSWFHVILFASACLNNSKKRVICTFDGSCFLSRACLVSTIYITEQVCIASYLTFSSFADRRRVNGGMNWSGVTWFRFVVKMFEARWSKQTCGWPLGSDHQLV